MSDPLDDALKTIRSADSKAVLLKCGEILVDKLNQLEQEWARELKRCGYEIAEVQTPFGTLSLLFRTGSDDLKVFEEFQTKYGARDGKRMLCRHSVDPHTGATELKVDCPCGMSAWYSIPFQAIVFGSNFNVGASNAD